MTESTLHLHVLTGASRGMGRALAHQLLRPGHALLCLSRGVDESLATRAQAVGVPLEQWSVDLVDPAPVADRLRAWLATQPASRLASVTLINNAGVIPPIHALADAQAADIARALRVGLEAPMALTAAFLDATRDWPGARRVLNVSSGLGRRPMASQSPYCAAKAGLDHFTRCVALEEAARPNGARVCSLAPGVIDTDMQVQLRAANDADFPDRAGFEQLHRGGQLSTPEAAAARVLAWLARADFGESPVADVRQG